MKIRTDFVTNSSSSSFITIVAYMKDGTVVKSQTAMDDIGHGMENPCTFSYVSNQELLDLLNRTQSGEDLIRVIDEHYCGMFRLSRPDENNCTSWAKKAYEHSNQEGICAIVDWQEVDEIMITDDWRGDYGKLSRYFIYVPSKQILKSQQKLPDDAESNEDESKNITKIEIPAKLGEKIHIKVRFNDNKVYSYLCAFRVNVGDIVYVEGKKEGIAGEVVEILETFPTGRTAKHILNVEKALNIVLEER